MIACVGLIIMLLGSAEYALAEGKFCIHFIDVGQADAAVILCDDEVLMIDGGNVADSSLVYSYLTKTLGINHIDYMIATHAHEDHVGGLAGALNACTVSTVYSPVENYDSEAFLSFRNYVEKQGKRITIPTIGDEFKVGSATVQFLSAGKGYSNTNDTSIVVRITYGDTSFIFTGDAEWEAEHDMVDAFFDLSADLIKVGHHGSDSSSSYVFLREVMPQYAVISVGADNSYGHPTENVLSRLRDVGAVVYRTDLMGNIVCHSDGERLTFETEHGNSEEVTNPGNTVWNWGNSISNQEEGNAPGSGTVWTWGSFSAEEAEDLENDYTGNAPYVGNKNNHKFHKATCQSVIEMKDKNKVEFYVRDAAVAAGYKPCGACNP